MDESCQSTWQHEYGENFCGLCRERLPGTETSGEQVHGKLCGCLLPCKNKEKEKERKGKLTGFSLFRWGLQHRS